MENYLIVVGLLIAAGLAYKAAVRKSVARDVYYALRSGDSDDIRSLMTVYGHLMSADLKDELVEWLKVPHERKVVPRPENEFTKNTPYS